MYHTREIFSSRYYLLTNFNKAVLIDMFQYLAGDVAVTSISQDVQDKLQVMQDPMSALIYSMKCWLPRGV